MNHASIFSITNLKEQVLIKKTSSTMPPMEIIQYIYGALAGASIAIRMRESPGDDSVNLTDDERTIVALKAVVDGNMIPARANKKYRQAIIEFCISQSGKTQDVIRKAAADQEKLKKLKAANLKAYKGAK